MNVFKHSRGLSLNASSNGRKETTQGSRKTFIRVMERSREYNSWI
jgi:hypothetical protein